MPQMEQRMEIKTIAEMQPGETYAVSENGRVYQYEIGAFRALPTPDGEIGELVEELNTVRHHLVEGDFFDDYDRALGHCRVVRRAATALETQAADIVRLRAALEGVRLMFGPGSTGRNLRAREIIDAALATKTASKD